MRRARTRTHVRTLFEFRKMIIGLTLKDTISLQSSPTIGGGADVGVKF